MAESTFKSSDRHQVTVKSLLKKHISRKMIFFVILCLLFTSFITFTKPLLIKTITDEGILGNDLYVLILFSLLLFISTGVEQFLDTIQARAFINVQNSIITNLYQIAFQKLYRLRQTYFKEHNSTEIVNAISTDIHTISTIADRGLIFYISYILSIVGGLLGLCILNWKMTLIVVAVVPIKIFISTMISNRNEEQVKKNIHANCDFYSWLGDLVNGIREIKLWNLCDNKTELLTKMQRRVQQISMERQIYMCVGNSVNNLLSSIVLSLLYISGGILYFHHSISLGGLTAFISYSSQVLAPIGALMSARYELSSICPSVKRFNDYLSLEEERFIPANEDQLHIPEHISSLEIHGLTFSYSDNTLLDDLNLKIVAGEKIAIIGSNGSGKTTLLDILLRFVEPLAGKIFVNGFDAGKYTNSEYWKLFSVVEQNPYFFRDSVKNNVDLCGTHNEREIIDVFNMCGNMTFINERFKGELDREIFGDALDLSGGERKRLAIARAILKNAPILIMDEAAADYDFETEANLKNLVIGKFTNKIVIYITHNYSYLDEFDKVFRLEKGQLNRLSDNEIRKLKAESI